MEVMAAPSTPEHSPHKKSKSAVFKSFVSPRSRGPSPSKGPILREIPNDQAINGYKPPAFKLNQIMLPADHPHAKQLVPSKPINDHNPPSPKKASVHNVDSGHITPESPTKPNNENSPMKRKLQLTIPKDKENATPANCASPTPNTPIWSQFANTSPVRKSWSKNAEEDQTKQMQPSKRVPPPELRAKTGERYQPHAKSWFDSKNSTRNDIKSSIVEPEGVSHQATMANGSTTLTCNTTTQATNGRNELDAALEAVLDARNVSENLRQNMRSLNSKIKSELVRHGQAEIVKIEKKVQANTSASNSMILQSPIDDRGRSARNNSDDDNSTSPSKRSRSRSRGFTFGRSDPAKNSRSLSRSRSLMSLRILSSKNLSSSSVHSFGLDGSKESKEQALTSTIPNKPSTLSSPDDFVKYLQETPTPQKIEIGKIHKLRVLTRNESISWIASFVSQGGFSELLRLLDQIIKITWREEHEDLLLHEVLLCLKGLSTTQPGLERLSEAAPTLFPNLLKMIFDEERKGPSEYNTRGVVMNLMLAHLTAANPKKLTQTAQAELGYLSDPLPSEDNTPLPFILEIQRLRPYQLWCKEITNVTKEVFWIFLHHNNIITVADRDPADVRSFAKRHFPTDRPPVAAAPYVGGVEWEATSYLADHLDLMNALIAAQPDPEGRNTLREQLKASGFEKVMGKALRTCKEKFYGAVHDGLRTWVASAVEDGWPVRDVQLGPVQDEARSPTKIVKKEDEPPKIELPKLDFGVENNGSKGNNDWI